MPFTNGTFLNVAGATSAASGQTIQSAVWNSMHADYSGALNIVATQLVGETAFKNLLWTNGGLEIWQRGSGDTASISVPASNTLYTADRWYMSTGANQDSTVSAQTGLTANSRLCARAQRTAGQTGVTELHIGFPLDTFEVARMKGKFAYLSLAIRAGANFSPTSGNVNIELAFGTGAGPAKRGSFTGFTQSIIQTVALTTNVQIIQLISPLIVPTTATQAQVSILWTPVGTAGASDYIEIDDVELVAIPAAVSTNYLPDAYEHIPPPVSLEGCKRHYQKTFAYSTTPVAGGGVADSIKYYTQAAETIGYLWVYAPELRGSPSLTKYHPTTATSSNWLNLTTGASASAQFAAFASADTTRSILIISSVSTSAAGQTMAIHAAASSGI